ncbi:MAG: GTP cyclohydrolase II [Oligoflexia bacterium]|nr:GTP cyclohydrolase II [Oligoflexia bacterium]
MNEVIELTPIPQVLAEFRAGKCVIIVDDVGRENEGDLVVASEKATPEALAFMLREARGLICVSISSDTAGRLNLPFQTLNNNSQFNTPFTVTTDSLRSVGRGVTAQGRCDTIKHMLEPAATAQDFVSPGHVFPLVANSRGVLGRRGQTEGSYDLARLAGLAPSGIICEILASDGTMARGAELQEFAAKHGISVTSVEEIARYRLAQDVKVSQVAQAPVQTQFGVLKTVVFEDESDGAEHMALIYGERAAIGDRAPLVRLHSECLTGDVFGSRRCDCGEQLDFALKEIRKEGYGVVLYLRQEGRGIGLGNKLRAYELQDQGHDTVEANIKLGFKPDERDFAVAARMLLSLELDRVRLLTNNPLKLSRLEENGVSVEERLPVRVAEDEYSRAYLETKRAKLGHLL